MEKTEYRIIPHKTFIGDIYLQFKDVEKWRFIPKELAAYVLGRYLEKNNCPISIPAHQEDRFLHSFLKQEEYELIPFTKRYENIEDYFEYLRKKREEHLKDKREKEQNTKIIYL